MNQMKPFAALDIRGLRKTFDRPALDIRGLRKTFDRPAVDSLDLTVRAGEFYSLLGPNGAGKTTTLRMVAGLLRPDAGTIAVSGIDALHDPVAIERVATRARAGAA